MLITAVDGDAVAFVGDDDDDRDGHADKTRSTQTVPQPHIPKYEVNIDA